MTGADGSGDRPRLDASGFYLPQHPELIAGGDWPVASWDEQFAGSEDAWITQSFLRLRAAGHPVGACGPDGLDDFALVVVHPAHLVEVLAARHGRGPALAVTIADKTYGRQGADFLITQNGLDPGGNRVFVPHWPQAGLLPRDPARRGLHRAAFKGRIESLHPALRSPAWSEALADLGIEWHVDEDHPADAAGPSAPHPWSDYREVDLVVALRPPDRDPRKSKPATKLVNAWLAGVPAVLGAEEQYRELRCSDDDYLEARDPAEALAAIEGLRDDPARFERMVAHGRTRAREFSVDAVTARWVETLADLQQRSATRGRLEATYRRAMQRAYRRRASRGRS